MIWIVGGNKMVDKYILKEYGTFNKIAGGILAADIAGIAIRKAMAVTERHGYYYLGPDGSVTLEGALMTGTLIMGFGLVTMVNEIPFSYGDQPSYRGACFDNSVLGLSTGVGMAYLAIQAGEYLSQFF